MPSGIIVTKLGLYGKSKKLSSQIKTDGQPAMVDVLLHLQKVLVPRDLLQQLARVRRVELDAEVERERLHAFYLSVDLLVRVEPVRLRQGVDEAQAEVRCLQQIQVLVDHIQKVLASGSVLYLLYEFSFVQEDYLAVEGLGFLAKTAPHGESTALTAACGHSPAENRIFARRSCWHSEREDSPGLRSPSRMRRRLFRGRTVELSGARQNPDSRQQWQQEMPRSRSRFF